MTIHSATSTRDILSKNSRSNGDAGDDDDDDDTSGIICFGHMYIDAFCLFVVGKSDIVSVYVHSEIC